MAPTLHKICIKSHDFIKVTEHDKSMIKSHKYLNQVNWMLWRILLYLILKAWAGSEWPSTETSDNLCDQQQPKKKLALMKLSHEYIRSMIVSLA